MRLCAPFLDPLVLLALVVPDFPKCRFIDGLKGLPGTGLGRDGRFEIQSVMFYWVAARSARSARSERSARRASVGVYIFLNLSF